MSIRPSALKVPLKSRRWCISLQIYAGTIHQSSSGISVAVLAQSSGHGQDGNAKTEGRLLSDSFQRHSVIRSSCCVSCRATVEPKVKLQKNAPVVCCDVRALPSFSQNLSVSRVEISLRW